MSYFKRFGSSEIPSSRASRKDARPGRARTDSHRGIGEHPAMRGRRCFRRARDAASLAEMVTVTAYQEISRRRRRLLLGLDGTYGIGPCNRGRRSPGSVSAGLPARCCGRSFGPSRPKPTSRRATVSEPAADATPAKPAKVAPPHWRRDRGPPTGSLREELSELVEDDPETAANILRNWIGQVS